MSLQLNLDQIFPIKDAESARLAMLKANYLQAINVIDARERQFIFVRALAVLDTCCIEHKVPHVEAKTSARSTESNLSGPVPPSPSPSTGSPLDPGD